MRAREVRLTLANLRRELGTRRVRLRIMGLSLQDRVTGAKKSQTCMQIGDFTPSILVPFHFVPAAREILPFQDGMES